MGWNDHVMGPGYPQEEEDMPEFPKPEDIMATQRRIQACLAAMAGIPSPSAFMSSHRRLVEALESISREPCRWAHDYDTPCSSCEARAALSALQTEDRK